jgi:hypothetical protein
MPEEGNIHKYRSWNLKSYVEKNLLHAGFLLDILP